MSEAISHAMFVLDLQGVVPPPTGIKDLVAWTNTIGGTPRAVVLFEALCSPLTLPESDSETEALQATSLWTSGASGHCDGRCAML
jgi:hypothetical protein